MPNSSAGAQANWDFWTESNTGIPAPCGARADQVLDEAVCEIFSSGALPEVIANLDELWDTTAFGEEKVQDDTQLGFLLERFLEEEG